MVDESALLDQGFAGSNPPVARQAG